MTTIPLNVAAEDQERRWSPPHEVFASRERALAVGVGFARLGNISPLRGTFEALFKFRLAYCEPNLRNRTERLNSTEDVSTSSRSGEGQVGHWATWEEDCPNRPDVSGRCFANYYSLQFVETSSARLEHEFNGHHIPGLVHIDMWIRGTFYEYFELEDFPYDVQKLSIHVRSTIGEKEYYLVPWPKKTGFEMRCQLPDFTFFDPALIELSDETDRDGSQRDHRVIVTAVVRRQPRFYELNVIIMLCMLTTISFVTFFMDARDDLSSNIEITLTLILTAVAFRFSISGKLPTVSYMTVLDKYIMASFLFLMLVVIENLLCALVVPKEYEVLLVIVVAGSWILFNLVFLLRRCIFLRQLSRAIGKLSLANLPEGEADDRLVKWKIL
mmetsp:Transcript_41790/g.110622  ORF Transcript_41790/g.110622 Transcript_41790/m.110622 type:complete len:384 (-) Transcript_41790:397-1548(-)|eukprot:CAMPEP_0194543136 /NCGR_PEP_ID=MMETSP0253-20130528/85280_1 /TAXON_ID=2966 /ORGANISM="Noctiluca scintillans" /LENGTH=383 /DNA_ID=CAMNT_0039389873 /DNA_START=45 /DNA_END=1196 /DNA_ORIENTATION=-